MEEDDLELQLQDPNSYFDGIGIMDSDLPVHDFAAADPDSVVTQDVMEDVVRENVLFSDILEEAAISENVIIPEQVLASDVTEEMSLTHCTMPHDILASDITTDSVSVPEHVFPSECRYVSDLGHVEHVVHDNVEAEIVTDILTSDLISEEVLVADCASEAVLNTTEIYVYQQNYDKGHSEDNLMISLDDAAKLGHNNITEKSIDTESENNPFKVDDRSPEIINVYSFKSDPGEDDIVGTGGDTLEKETENEHGGELFDQNSSVHVPREKMIYVTVNDSQPENMYLNISELTDDVCMGLIVGQEDVAAAAAATKHEQEMDNSEIKNFMPIEWETGHGTDSDGTKNQNTSASTPLQIDESAGISGLAQQTPKKMRRSTSRHYQTETIIGPDGHPLTVYLCMVCEKKFKSRSFLKKHMKMYPEHQTKKKYSCPDCPYSTNKEHSLQNHLESHKATGKTEKATESGESGKDFSHPGALLTHKVTQKEKGAHKTYKCKFCKYEAVEYALLNCHLLTVHRKNFPRICVECGKGFKHPSELKRHMRIHTGEKPFPCQYCEYKSADSSKLKSHVKTKHSKEVPFKCDTCLLIFSDSKEMQQHAVIHQESNNHQCLHCDHKSSTPNDLKLHVISVHTKDYPHKCDMCDRGFHQASDLKNHVAAVHKDTTTHPCKHCDFRIADPFLLSRHILSVHSQRLLYKCQRCQKEFQQQEELDNHVRTHSSKKVFKCEYCDYKTTDASGFKRHVISIHTKNYPHRCEYCQKGFRRPSEKKQHILRHHKEAVLPPEILRTETFIPSRQDRDPPSSSATGC